MAQQKRRKTVQPQARTWTVSRFLLLIGYGLVFVFLGTLFLMRQELLRVGIFGNKSAAPAPRSERPPQAMPEPQRPAAIPPQVATETQSPNTSRSSSASSAPRQQGEITSDEKKALDDIIRSKR